MSQKIYSNLDIKGNAKIGDITNATSDTDKFLVSDAGVVKYRTGSEMLSDLGVAPGVASNIQHQVKAGVAINKGQAVYVTGADGTNMIVGLASNASEATSSKTMGLMASTVATNGFGNVIAEGLLAGLDTSTANAGDPVWLGTGGNLIYGLTNKPYAPAHLVFIGIVTRVNNNNGEIFVKAQNGFELNEIHDVDLYTTTPTGGNILAFEGAPVNLWRNKTIPSVLGYTPVSQARTLTINGTTFDLSADRSWTIASGVTSFNTRTGAITLSSSDVTTALGYTPYNATNPNGYISSYTETDTLATVTARGASTSSAITLSNSLTLAGFGSNSFINGTGDGSSFSTYNFALSGWSSMAFYNPTSGGTYPTQVCGLIDFREGRINMKGGFRANGQIVLHEGNFNSWAPTVQGGNASGTWPISITGNADTVDNLHATDFVRAYGTSNDNIDSDWGQSFKTFDPIPSGTPPISSPNLRTINIGENYSRRTQLSFDYAANRAWFRRRQDSTWSAWSEFIHSDNISSFAVPSSRTITINGTSYDLSANRSWTVTASETDTLATVVSRGNSSGNIRIEPSSASWAEGIQFYMPTQSTWGGLRWVRNNSNYYGSWYQGYTALDASNDLVFGANNSGTQVNNILRMTTSGDVTAGYNIKAPIFYASDDTSYYVDPNSTSNIDRLMVGGGITDPTYTRISTPGGGSYVTTASTVNGAIRILLPTQGSAMMMTCTIKVYEYSTNKSFTITVGGHRDSANWYNEFCYMDGGENRGELTVRFGVDSGKDCIYIGETNSSWSYPQVFVTDVELGYTGYNANWTKGWSVGFVTSFASVTRTQTAYRKLTPANYSSYALPLSGGTMSGQIYTPTAGTGVYDGAIQIREYGYVGSGQYDWSYAPAMTFHWGNRAVKKFGMRSDGYFAIDDVPIVTANGGTWSINISGNASTVGSATVNTLRGGVAANPVNFTVNGDANTYYPVQISTAGDFGFNRYSIYRGYSETAPWDPIGTGSHKGGLTFTFDFAGDIAWGGNDKSWRIIEFGETYTTMVAGMVNPVTGGLIVWLRGGGAAYHLQGPAGINHTVDVYYSGYSAANGAFYGVRTNTNEVAGEILSKYPIRGYGNGQIYINNNNVLYESSWINNKNFGTDGSIYGTVFYDSDNSAYKVDPTGTSNLSDLYANQFFVNGNYNGIRFNAGASSDLVISCIPGTRTFEIRNGNGPSPNYGACGLITGAGTFTTTVTAANLVLNQNPVGSTYGAGQGGPPNSLYQAAGGDDGFRIYAESPASNRVRAVFQIEDDIETESEQWVFRNKRTYSGLESVNSVTISGGGTLTANGDVIAYSDRRVKENINIIEDALNKVKALRGVTYNRTDKKDKSEKIGVIAQEIQEVLPQVVFEQEDGMLGVSYGNITAVLIEAIKEQQTQIEELKELVNKLINK